MSGASNKPPLLPGIAVTAKTGSNSAEAGSQKAPAIGTATSVAKATATGGTSTRSAGFAANAGSEAEAAGFSAAASGGNNEKPQGFTLTAESEEEFIESVLADNAQEGDNNAADPDDQGKVEVKKNVIRELLKDYEIPKDDSIKEAFRSMVANYFVFRENSAVIKKEWQDKLKGSDPSLMDRVKSLDPTPENIVKTIIKSCADKCKINEKSGVQYDNTTSSPTVTPVPKSSDPTDKDGTAPPVGGGTFIAQLAEKGKGLLSSIKKKITDLISGANGTQDKDNTSSFAPVATSEQINEEVRRKADYKEKTPTDQRKVSDKAGINPKTLTSLHSAEGEMDQLSNSSSTLDPSVGLPKTTAEPPMLMMEQHAAAAAAKSPVLPKPPTSDGPDSSRIGTPVTAVGPHRAP